MNVVAHPLLLLPLLLNLRFLRKFNPVASHFSAFTSPIMVILHLGLWSMEEPSIIDFTICPKVFAVLFSHPCPSINFKVPDGIHRVLLSFDRNKLHTGSNLICLNPWKWLGKFRLRYLWSGDEWKASRRWACLCFSYHRSLLLLQLFQNAETE